MKKPVAVHFTSSVTVLDGTGNEFEIKRDSSGGYEIHNDETAIYLGNAKSAWCVAQGIEQLLDENDDD